MELDEDVEALDAAEAVLVPSLAINDDVLGLSDQEAALGATLLVSAPLADVLAVDRVVRLDDEGRPAPVAGKALAMVGLSVGLDDLRGTERSLAGIAIRS